MQTPFHFLYGSQAYDLRSTFGIEESVQRLRASTRRHAFILIAQDVAVGPVSEDRVRLERVSPLFRNSFKPIFYGRFEQRIDGVHLSGHFTMPWFNKAFMTVWLGLALVFGIHIAANYPWNNAAALAAFGMLVFGLLLVSFGKWLSRNDAAWLSAVMQEALGPPAPAALPAAFPAIASPAVPSRSPMVLRIAALLLLLLGAACASIGATQIWIAHGVPADATAVQGQAWLGPGLLFYGLWMLALAAGVHRRRLWAWRQVLALMAAPWLLSFLPLLQAGISREEHFTQLIFPLMSLPVTAVWVWGWYVQRRHFESESGLPDLR
jgi:hypothetical protein